MKRAELVSVEPHIPEWIYGGLYMPTGGITSPYQMTVALAENAVQNGARVMLNTVVEGMRTEGGKILEVCTNRGIIRPKLVINAAGVYSDIVADMAGDRTFTVHPRKGTDIILDKKKGYMVRTSMAKSPTTVPPPLDGEEEKHAGGLKAVVRATAQPYQGHRQHTHRGRQHDYRPRRARSPRSRGHRHHGGEHGLHIRRAGAHIRGARADRTSSPTSPECARPLTKRISW